MTCLWGAVIVCPLFVRQSAIIAAAMRMCPATGLLILCSAYLIYLAFLNRLRRLFWILSLITHRAFIWEGDSFYFYWKPKNSNSLITVQLRDARVLEFEMKPEEYPMDGIHTVHELHDELLWSECEDNRHRKEHDDHSAGFYTTPDTKLV